jgi:hypothetical protein
MIYSKHLSCPTLICMLMPSNLVGFSAGVLGAALSMLSCASSAPPDRLTVHVPAQRNSSILHVDTCVSDAPGKEVYVDERGIGKTSLCPASEHTVDVEVVEGDRHQKLASPDVLIRRTGDGIATSIEAPIREQ